MLQINLVTMVSLCSLNSVVLEISLVTIDFQFE